MTEELHVFSDQAAWRAWLEEHHDTESEIWLLHPKKASEREGVRYPEAVEEALAFGWIDSKKYRVDEETFAQRYSRRKPQSVWSRNNVERVERLIVEGRMTPAGLAIVEEAKRRGTWQAAYTDHKPEGVPDDLVQALKEGEAWVLWEAFPQSVRNNYTRWVIDAKRPETRARRIAQVVERSATGKRPGEP